MQWMGQINKKERGISMYVNPGVASLHRIKSDEGRADYLRLDMNESPEGLPKDFFDRVIATLTPQKIAMYPEVEELIALLAKNLDVQPSNITLGSGSDEILRTIFQVFGQAGKNLVAVNPSFAMYSIYAQMVGMKNSLLNYDENLEVSVQQLLDLIDENTGIVSLVNPNNPMGNVYSVEEVAQIAEKADKYGALVIVDEAYHYFYPETMIPLVSQHKNLIVTRTFSKLCAMAGLRIGYAVAQSDMIRFLDMARPTYCVNTVAITFATMLLEEKGMLNSLIDQAVEGKKYICDQLQKSGYDFIAKEGNFLFIKTNHNPTLIENMLKEAHVLVKTYSAPVVKDYIRISTGSVETMQAFWRIFSKLDAEEKL